VPLVDDLAARVGPVQEVESEERGFYEIEELDDPGAGGQCPRSIAPPEPVAPAVERESRPTRGSGCSPGTIERVPEYAHVLVDEAQDLSPMQWRLLGRRGRYASWTVVGDAAQSVVARPRGVCRAREQAWGGQAYRHFHMTTNYRNAREIFDYAAAMIRRFVPDADIPDAVRESGALPVEEALGDDVLSAVERAVVGLAGQVEGTIAVITPDRYAVPLGELVPRLGQVDPAVAARVRVTDPLSTKGLEYDATVVVDPDEIAASCAGGVRTAYVVLTRAAHRMVVLRTRSGW
jgi:DNA helicase IV